MAMSNIKVTYRYFRYDMLLLMRWNTVNKDDSNYLVVALQRWSRGQKFSFANTPNI